MRREAYEVPDEFRDEDKWFGLTKRQWAILGPVALIVVILVIATISAGLTLFLPIVFILCGVLILAGIIVAFFEMPYHWYLFGSGFKIERILFRILRKKLSKKSKTIYTKHYDNGTERG